jgi:endogenous inhibitor of DNA gyrase (YacG/DUF329 family)
MLYPCRNCIIKKQCNDSCDNLNQVRIWGNVKDTVTCPACGSNILQNWNTYKKCPECNTIIAWSAYEMKCFMSKENRENRDYVSV